MDSGRVYQPPGLKLSQGDIIRNVVHVIYSPPPIALRSRSAKGGTVYDPFEYDPGRPPNRQPQPPKGGFKFSEGDNVIARANMGTGMIISHGCDIDKPKCKHWLVAPVRDLGQLPPPDQETIRGGRNNRFFHLPAYRDELPESYVDLRRISSIAVQPLGELDRVVSLTEEHIQDLHWHLFRFITRREIVVEDIDSIAPIGEE